MFHYVLFVYTYTCVCVRVCIKKWKGIAEPHQCTLQTLTHSVHGNKSLGDLRRDRGGSAIAEFLCHVLADADSTFSLFFSWLTVLMRSERVVIKGGPSHHVHPPNLSTTQCRSSRPLQTDSYWRWWPLSGDIWYLKLAVYTCCYVELVIISSQPFSIPDILTQTRTYIWQRLAAVCAHKHTCSFANTIKSPWVHEHPLTKWWIASLGPY